ncbi:methyltransferase domain-containing protein [Streptococcus hyovaginalis]|uniref:methyltransferase domain-containing protein n=1 Tax=Streptococcus hyovaginalis TaxID=149015 RepID=UPI0004A37C94|nr:methyltransferase domain-containing protein [Streptococcus hyovaginalis]
MSEKLHATATLFICPICQETFSAQEKRFVCPQGHSFDMGKQGYINLLRNAKKDKHYDKRSFEERHQILESGFYDHILEAVAQLGLSETKNQVILDVACGEGYYARQLAQMVKNTVLAFDLSKDSITLAAKKDKDKDVAWFVGDLAKLPLADQSVDLILDIFSPANYQEFKRVLKPGGKIIKVVTASQHVTELRQAALEQLQTKNYSNVKIISHFAQAFPHYRSNHISQTFPATIDVLKSFAQMTPLFFHVDLEKIDWKSIDQITIAADILVADYHD